MEQRRRALGQVNKVATRNDATETTRYALVSFKQLVSQLLKVRKLFIKSANVCARH